MFKFIKGILSETDGTPSSRRVVMFLLTLLFIGISVYNIVTGKNYDDTLKNQLFYLLCWLFTVIFGDKIAGLFTKKDAGNTPLGGGGGDRPKDPPPNP